MQETQKKGKRLPLKRVDPPARWMLAYRSLRRSRSTLVMESTMSSCTPWDSSPIISGLKRISGAVKRSSPIWHKVEHKKQQNKKIHNENKRKKQQQRAGKGECLEDVAIRERVVHWLVGVVFEVFLQVLRDNTDLLLQRPHNLLFRRGREAVSTLAQEELQIVCHIPVFFTTAGPCNALVSKCRPKAKI